MSSTIKLAFRQGRLVALFGCDNAFIWGGSESKLRAYIYVTLLKKQCILGIRKSPTFLSGSKILFNFKCCFLQFTFARTVLQPKSERLNCGGQPKTAKSSQSAINEKRPIRWVFLSVIQR